MFLADRRNHPPFPVLSWTVYCDVCKNKIGYKGFERTITIKIVAGKEVDKEDFSFSENSQFNGLVKKLRKEGHIIPEGPWAVTCSKYWYPRSQVNCICKECVGR